MIEFSLERIRDSKRTKIQKFIDGLNLELQHDVQGYEVTTLGALVNKAKPMVEIKSKIKAQDDLQKGSLGQRSFGYFENKKFKTGSSLRRNKKPMVNKIQN